MKKLLFIIPFILAYVGAYISGGNESVGLVMAVSSIPALVIILTVNLFDQF